MLLIKYKSRDKHVKYQDVGYTSLWQQNATFCTR